MMNKLVIIGNGFDLAHGMKTSYRDFVDWLVLNEITNLVKEVENNRENLRNSKFSIQGAFFTIQIFNNNYILEGSEHEIFKLAEFYAKEGTGLLQYLINSKNLSSNISFSIDRSNNAPINLIFNEIIRRVRYKNKLDWCSIEDIYYKLLVKYINSPLNEVEKLNEDLEKIKNHLRIYLIEQVSSGKIDINSFFKYEDDDIKEFKEESNQNRYQCLLNFNYTQTYKPYLKNFLSDNRFEEVINIHNTLEDKSIVFGYGDEIDEEYNRLEKLNDNRFLENVKSVAYLENNNYTRLLDFIEDDYFYIYIMGHSCGLSDRTLLNTIFEHKNCVFIKLFYHEFKNDDGIVVGDNFKELSINISRHFNDKKELRKKVLNKEKCVPLPQWND